MPARLMTDRMTFGDLVRIVDRLHRRDLDDMSVDGLRNVVIATARLAAVLDSLSDRFRDELLRRSIHRRPPAESGAPPCCDHSGYEPYWWRRSPHLLPSGLATPRNRVVRHVG